ncbi:hypothetical protein O0I10_004182 [Lichtheimia ornata]|uniref:Uncharacterized protein n=1 Tax=Lichtheimia ornata TaxID=688661 RepID=A0AAD7V7K7_9FUNG|nr:uncharacterized protein O0I10_004182 [Lichtheimia ornata]KAJ8659956.1 hypothetical protein O0I10_004182 [Lichtheimia ornata]
MNRYPGGLTAYTEVDCIKARTVKEHFIEQCAVLRYYQHAAPWRFEKLPSLAHEELGSDIANRIDSIRLYHKAGYEIVFHVHFETKDACISALKKMRKGEANKTIRQSPLQLYRMFTLKKIYSIYTIRLPLDSPANALNEIKQALAPTKRVIVDILLGTDDMFKKYNGTASIILQGQGCIDITLYGTSFTIYPEEQPKITGYLYCKHCKFINDHDTDECPHQPEAQEQPEDEGQSEDEKQGEEFEKIDNNGISNDSTHKTNRL